MLAKIFAIILLFLLTPGLFAQANQLPWLRVNGQNVVNEEDQTVLLNGINLSNNVWGNWVDGISEKLEAEGKDPMIRPIKQDGWVLTDADFERLKKLGPKVVRYCINDELFTEDNKLRENNLKKLLDHINKFNQLGIYVMVNLHLPPGLDGQDDNFERDKPGPLRIRSLFEDDVYWQKTKEIWQYLASNLKDLPAVAGYSLYNEPRLPCEADGGLSAYKTKQNKLVKAIRQIDQKHIIFIPEYNSREDNDPNQTVIWERGLVEVEDKNVVYVFSFYEPYEFTHLGSSSFDAGQLENTIKEKVNWTKRVGAPLLVCEYGLSRNQDLENRLKYIKTFHKLINKYKIPTIYWEYKSIVGAFAKPLYIFGLFGEYLNRKDEIIELGGDYKYQEWAYKPASDNHFDALFRKYFWKSKASISLMDNEPIWQELQRRYR